MRDRNFRRKQEAKHFKKRVETSIALGRYAEITNDDGATITVPISTYKSHQPWICQSDIKNADKNKHKRWKFALKNDSMPSELSSWSKRYCRRIRRHFQKLVDYKLPDKMWMVRGDVLNYEDRVSQ